MKIRAATTNDADTIVNILTASKAEYLPYLPTVHTPEEDLNWAKNTLIPKSNVVIAQYENQDVGVLSTSVENQMGWIDQLYLLPGFTGRGIGSKLLAHALIELPRPVRLWAFQANTKARQFYESHGFIAIKLTDGENNEEKTPDVLFELG